MDEQKTAKVYIGRSVPRNGLNPQKLMKKAEAVASALTVPAGVEFARFECEGRVYALSARLIIEVEALGQRVPDVVIRQGDFPKPPKRKVREGIERPRR